MEKTDLPETQEDSCALGHSLQSTSPLSMASAEQAFPALSPGTLHPSAVCLETGLMMRPPALSSNFMFPVPV